MEFEVGFEELWDCIIAHNSSKDIACHGSRGVAVALMVDREYIAGKGLATIRKHAEDFVAKRLAPAVISNDGKQTPMRGHPVFIAQHATGCCCRGCFFKWHHIPTGRQLTREEQQYAVEVLMAWIERQYTSDAIIKALCPPSS